MVRRKKLKESKIKEKIILEAVKAKTKAVFKREYKFNLRNLPT